MEKPCQRCKIVTITDEDSKLCYDCWVDLDIIDHELNDQFICLCIHRVYMAKLYWRVKKNDKWTWRPVSPKLMQILNNLGLSLWDIEVEEWDVSSPLEEEE